MHALQMDLKVIKPFTFIVVVFFFIAICTILVGPRTTLSSMALERLDNIYKKCNFKFTLEKDNMSIARSI